MLFRAPAFGQGDVGLSLVGPRFHGSRVQGLDSRAQELHGFRVGCRQFWRGL